MSSCAALAACLSILLVPHPAVADEDEDHVDDPTPVAAEARPRASYPRAALVTLGASWGSFPEDAEGARYAAEIGLRLSRAHLEVDGLVGRFGDTLGDGAGFAAKLHVGGDRAGAYLRGAALLADRRGLELGVGLRRPAGLPSLEYFVEVDLVRISDGTPGGAGARSGAKVVVPITAGLTLKL